MMILYNARFSACLLVSFLLTRLVCKYSEISSAFCFPAFLLSNRIQREQKAIFFSLPKSPSLFSTSSPPYPSKCQKQTPANATGANTNLPASSAAVVANDPVDSANMCLLGMYVQFVESGSGDRLRGRRNRGRARGWFLCWQRGGERW